MSVENMPGELEAPLQFLLRYFEAMLEWVREHRKRRTACNRGEITFEEEVRLNADNWKEIHRRYFVRGDELEGGHSYVWPPQYSIERNGLEFNIVASSSTKVAIEVTAAEIGAYGYPARYEIILADERWWIRRRLMLSDDGSRWCRNDFCL